MRVCAAWPRQPQRSEPPRCRRRFSHFTSFRDKASRVHQSPTAIRASGLRQLPPLGLVRTTWPRRWTPRPLLHPPDATDTWKIPGWPAQERGGVRADLLRPSILRSGLGQSGHREHNRAVRQSTPECRCSSPPPPTSRTPLPATKPRGVATTVPGPGHPASSTAA